MEIVVFIFILLLFAVIFFTRENNKLYFRDSMELCDLPVVPFKEGNVQMNFLIDTGSNYSHISEAASKLLLGEPIEADDTFITGNGSMTSSKKMDVALKSGKKEFKHSLFINSSLDESFKSVAESNGIVIHGILGSDFLSKFNYTIDFRSLKMYPKK